MIILRDFRALAISKFGWSCSGLMAIFDESHRAGIYSAEARIIYQGWRIVILTLRWQGG
jgi:hypothetical protein